MIDVAQERPDCARGFELVLLVSYTTLANFEPAKAIVPHTSTAASLLFRASEIGSCHLRAPLQGLCLRRGPAARERTRPAHKLNRSHTRVDASSAAHEVLCGTAKCAADSNNATVAERCRAEDRMLELCSSLMK